MQRRAAAIYGAIFLVLALGSYGMIAAASAPPVSVSNPDYSQGNDTRFTVSGQPYHVTVNQGSATLQWTDQDAEYATTWAPGDQVTVGGTNYTVAIPNGTEPPVVELTEARPLPAGVERTELNGTTYAVTEGRNGTRELVPLDRYLDERYGPERTRTLQGGQVFEYRGNRTQVTAITNDSAELTWTAPRAMSEQLGEGDTVDLSGETFVAHFPAPDRLVLDRDVQAYEAEVATVDRYHQRINGLWGVVILSGLAVVVLVSLSMLPSRY